MSRQPRTCTACEERPARQGSDWCPTCIAYAYCSGEIYSGGACRLEGCPTCGGPDQADSVLQHITEFMNRGAK